MSASPVPPSPTHSSTTEAEAEPTAWMEQRLDAPPPTYTIKLALTNDQVRAPSRLA